MDKHLFCQIRYSLYIAFVLNGIIQWLIPFQYRCNITGEECFACGLRTAVSLFVQGRFSEAYQSNRLIALIVIMGIAMAADVLTQLGKQLLGKHRAP